jgi:glucokinase
MRKLYLGLDIGGQSIKGIALDREGQVIAEYSARTPAAHGAPAVLSAIEAGMERLGSEGTVASVGVGTPGGVDKEGRVVGMSANISGWFGTALGESIRRMAKDAPTVVRNDGNIAAYAEWAVRRNQSKILLFVGLGTGIGGGYVIDGEILGGRNDRALEIGHSIVEPEGRKCVCGVEGCAEAYASGPSMGRIAMDLALGRDARIGSLAPPLDPRIVEKSPLASMAREGLVLNAREVYSAYKKEDPLAVYVDAVAAQALARTVAAALAFLAPDTVVLGGGVLDGAGHLLHAIASKVPSLVYSDAWQSCEFEEAALQSKAGLLGAAWYGASRILPAKELFDMIGAAILT